MRKISIKLSIIIIRGYALAFRVPTVINERKKKREAQQKSATRYD